MQYQRNIIFQLFTLGLLLALPACLLATGPGPGGTICDGRSCPTQDASACSQFYNANTCESEGCIWGSFCSGTATPCAYLTDATCDQQAGCGWDDATGTCGGSEGPCSAYVGTACIYQIGCQDAYGCVEN